jgi:hypothetical protein
MRIENDEQERRVVAWIEEKIRKEGRDSLTTAEENVYSYSRYGNAGGCPSVAFATTAKAPDYPPEGLDG